MDTYPITGLASGLLGFLIMFAVFFGIFLLVRQIMLWYWRINEIAYRQDHQIRLLEAIYSELQKLNQKEDTK